LLLLESLKSSSFLQGDQWGGLRRSQPVVVLSISHLYLGAPSSGWIQLDQEACLGPLVSLLVLTHLPFAALWGR